MNRMKSMLGYTWAILTLIVAPATYLGSDAFSRALASATGVVVSSLYSGGEVIRTIDHGSYRTDVHRPVFDALIGQTETGFIQIDWKPAVGLPSVIREAIDVDRDGRTDFTVTLDRAAGKADLESHTDPVLSLGKTYQLRDGWAVRVNLRRMLTPSSVR